MKKALIFVLIFGIAALSVACKNDNDVNVVFSEQTTQAQQNTESLAATEMTSGPTTAETTVTGEITFDNVAVDSNNAIDNAVSAMFDEADTTRKINQASEQFNSLWKAEMNNAVSMCKNNGVPGYTDSELTGIEQKAQAAYDAEINRAGGGSSAYGAALYESGEIYRQGTYYYIALYEAYTNSKYQFLYK